MSSHTIFIPQANSPVILENQFHWQFGSNPEVTAERSLFYLAEHPITGERGWSISGAIGSISLRNYFAYSMLIPYENDAPINATYTLDDKLSFKHSHSSPAPEGFEGFTTVDANKAILTIKLDPSRGIAVGTFEANFKSHGYRTQPIGRFNLVISE